MSQFHKLLQNECLKLIIQTYQMKNKELKMKLWQLQEEISKVSLPVSDDLSNDFESIFLETDQRKKSPFMRLFWEEQQKYLQSSENNATCHPVNIVTYRTANLFSSDKCFIYFIPDVPHNIWWNRQNTVYKILLKVDILDTCRAIITFLLFFTIVENVVHTSCQKIRQMVSGPEESAAEVTYLSMRKEPESCRIKSTFGGVLNIYKVKVGIEAIC